MKKQARYLILLLLFTFQKTKAQTCPMELGFYYTIYIFSSQPNYPLNELMGAAINPMLVHVVQVKDEGSKSKIDKLCLTGKMETCIFIYPAKDKTKILRFCNQQEYVNALKGNIALKLFDE